MACRVTTYLTPNKNVDRVVQKGGAPDIPGCLEHATMIWEAIHRAKMEKKVVWLDLVNVTRHMKYLEGLKQ